MNLSIRNDLPSLRNLQNAKGAAGSGSLYSLRANTTAPPENAANAAQTAQIQSKMKEQFAAQAADPRAFHDLMSKVYGEGYDQTKAESLRQKALAGDFSWLPPVRLLDSKTLHGANGAYDAQNGVVYINADIAAKNPALAASTFVEEAGAHLDTMLNRGDAAGDEGELLRRLMGGEKLSRQDVAAIKAENDHGVITVDGKQVSVEFWNPLKSIKNAAKKVGGAIKSVGKSIGRAAKGLATHVGNGLKATGKSFLSTGLNFMKGMTEAGRNLFSGIGKMTLGFGKNLFTGNVGEAFKSLFSGAGDIVIGMPKNILRSGINLVRDTLNTVTHLTPEFIGSKLRTVFDKSLTFVGDFTDAFLDKTREVGGLFTGTINDSIDLIEKSVRLAIKGKFGEAAGAFGDAISKIPENFGSRLKAMFVSSDEATA
jgi:hypothetical protein